MRILTLCYEYPPTGGGGGRVAQSVAEGLARRGHSVRVVTAALGFHSVREEICGVKIDRTASGRRRAESCGVFEMGLYVLTSFWPALRLCRRWRPDVIHAHFAMPTGVLAALLHRFTGIPYVLTAHLGDVPGGVPEQTNFLFVLLGPLARYVWRKAFAVTAVSAFVQELAERAYTRSVIRILNGVDLTRRPAEESLAIGTPRRLLFLGRFNPQKNALFLLDSLVKLKAEWRLTMIGDGPEMPAVKARLAALDLKDRVRLKGWQSAEEVAAELAVSDVLCLPSTSEGLPVAGVEALKYGLAIAASNIPGVRDVVSHGTNGISVPLPEYAAELDALLMDEPALLRARQASWRKAQDFALEAVVSAYEGVLTASVHTRPRRTPLYSLPV